jgi:hypothetical protein
MEVETKETRMILIQDELAFQSGSLYYPFLLKKRIRADGGTVYTVEMRIGTDDVIISDAPSLEEVLKKHSNLMKQAFSTRSLQGCPLR